MRRRPLGRTGMSVTELALGTWGLSGDGYGAVSEADQDRVIERAVAIGITLFETADTYAHGAMEQRLALRVPNDQRCRIVTKVGTDRDANPVRKRFDPAYLRDAALRSRDRLKRDAIDVLLLHNPVRSTVDKGAATAALAGLVEERTIRAWGVSAGDADVARAALEQGAQVVELAYNALWRGDVDALSERLRGEDTGLLARSVLGHGLLTGHWARDKVFGEGDHRRERWTDDELARRIRHLDALRPLVGGDVMTLRAGALRFALTNPLVSSVVLGPRSTVQLDQLVREAGKGPPYLEETKLGALLARLEQVGAT